MSLLIQALKQAERQNKLAAQKDANIDIELPPAPAPVASAVQKETLVPSHATSAGPGLTLEETAPVQQADEEEFPTLHTLSDMDEADSVVDTAKPGSLSLDHEPAGQASPRRNEHTDEPAGAEFPRHAEPDSTPGLALEGSAPATEAATVVAPAMALAEPEQAAQQPIARAPAPSETPAGPNTPSSPDAPSAPAMPASAAAPEAIESGATASYLTSGSRTKTKSSLGTPKQRWLVTAGIAVVIGGAVLWSPLVLTPGSSDAPMSLDFPAGPELAPAINPDGSFLPSGLAEAVPGMGNENTGLAPGEIASELTGSAAPATGLASATPQAENANATASSPDSQAPLVAAAASVAAGSSAQAKEASPGETGSLPGRQETFGKAVALPPLPAPQASTNKTTASPSLPAVRFVRAKVVQVQASDLLNKGYAALREQRFADAEQAYREALDQNKNLIDGWIGLASIAAHQGNSTMADQYYRRALLIDPNDAVAKSGLLSLGNTAMAAETESALRTLANDPVAFSGTQLTLGNSLANQGRWHEAQQAYFNANAAQPGRPDVLFNLAVSLERIHQPRLALQYYTQALDKAGESKVVFDPLIARQRIDALKAAQDS